MFASWKLGRVAGISVYLHSTFLLLLAFIALTEGGIGSVLLVSSVFGCVLLHELGHALTARRFGIRTEDITLYPIGGVARLSRMPRAPGAELTIALAGPAVNVLIAITLTFLFNLGLFGSLWSMSPLGRFVLQLIQINWLLACFNLIPAFPMDGGRVLRALLSGWLGRGQATRIAAAIGRGLALAFGVYSLIQFQFLQVILAGFIYLMAGSELARVLAEEAHGGAGGRWDRDRAAGEGIWTAPPGFHWVNRGGGVWQLAPNVVAAHDRMATPWR